MNGNAGNQANPPETAKQSDSHRNRAKHASIAQNRTKGHFMPKPTVKLAVRTASQKSKKENP